MIRLYSSLVSMKLECDILFNIRILILFDEHGNLFFFSQQDIRNFTSTFTNPILYFNSDDKRFAERFRGRVDKLENLSDSITDNNPKAQSDKVHCAEGGISTNFIELEGNFHIIEYSNGKRELYDENGKAVCNFIISDTVSPTPEILGILVALDQYVRPFEKNEAVA